MGDHAGGACTGPGVRATDRSQGRRHKLLQCAYPETSASSDTKLTLWTSPKCPRRTCSARAIALLYAHTCHQCHKGLSYLQGMFAMVTVDDFCLR